MKRRWFIRICFMLPILLCVGGWAWSEYYINAIGICYNQRSYSVECGIGESVVFLNAHPATFAVGPPPLGHFWMPKTPYMSAFLGFGYMHDAALPLYRLAIPFWFLVVVFTSLLWLIWQKTRPKLNPKTAFPVEPSKPNEEQVGKAT